jgi:hypothetical protein
MAHGLQLSGARFQAGAELFGTAAGVVWLKAGLFACTHVHVEPNGAV